MVSKICFLSLLDTWRKITSYYIILIILNSPDLLLNWKGRKGLFLRSIIRIALFEKMCQKGFEKLRDFYPYRIKWTGILTYMNG